MSLMVVLCVCLSDDARSQSVQPDKKADSNSKSISFSTNGLQRLDSFMSEATDSGSVIGTSVLVLQDEEEAFFKTWGYQDRERGISISRDTIFRIYSMTKPITTVAAMQLVEQNKLGLDSPVAKYIKSFSGLKVAGSNKDSESNDVSNQSSMTIRDLMRHTSGLTYGYFDVTNPVDQIYLKDGGVHSSKSLEEMVAKLSKIPLKHPPATQFEYSLSTDVLARVIEIVSGDRFDQYLKKNIFDPLEMNDTSFYVPVNKRDRLAVMYSDDGQGELEITDSETSSQFLDSANQMFSGGGGLCSTIDDYAKFARMLMREGEGPNGKVLNAESIAQMFTNQLAGIKLPPRTLLNQDAPWTADNFTFGLGFSIENSPFGTDYTWNGIAGTQFWVNPESGTIILYMVQVFPLMGHDLASEVKSLVYQSANAE